MGSFDGQKYLSLETFRKNGTGVRTPVWFAAEAGKRTLYVYTLADSGKAKRLRRNNAVRIAPCDARGTVKGGWQDATARIITGSAAEQGMQRINRKYWPFKQVLDVFIRLRPGRQRIVIAIEPVS